MSDKPADESYAARLAERLRQLCVDEHECDGEPACLLREAAALLDPVSPPEQRAEAQ